MTTHQLNFEELRHERVTTNGRSVLLVEANKSDSLTGALRFEPGNQLAFGDTIGTIDSEALFETVIQREALTRLSCQPQLAAYLFALTHKARLMNHYFPITQALDHHEETEFHRLIVRIAQNPNFDLHLFGEQRQDHGDHLPPDAGYLVAGHIAEIFFYRSDLLDQFLRERRGFYLYTTPQAFQADGGVAGGDYDAQRGAIQLVLSRLYEGFYAPTPGVAPFIHEFGHMLDQASGGRGLIPGMDGGIDLFRRGKALEIERYERQSQHPGSEPFPVGHPYVFQNDGEFIAGYLEMFFRNPHTFAAQNPDLFQAFAQCLGQDPRRYWREDFPFYVEQNREFYLSGQRLRRHGLTLPQ